MQPIVITVEGGVIQDIDGIPPGVVVEVHDYDCDLESGESIEKDHNGDVFFLSTYTGD